MSLNWEPPDTPTPNLKPNIPPSHLLAMIVIVIGIWALIIWTVTEVFTR